MREELKFRASDFIPVVGLFRYINRNKGGAYYLEPIKWGEFFSFYFRDTALLLYNIAIGTGVIMGLEKLLQ